MRILGNKAAFPAKQIYSSCPGIIWIFSMNLSIVSSALSSAQKKKKKKEITNLVLSRFFILGIISTGHYISSY